MGSYPGRSGEGREHGKGPIPGIPVIERFIRPVQRLLHKRVFLLIVDQGYPFSFISQIVECERGGQGHGE